MLKTIPIQTKSREEFLDITGQIRELLRKNSWKNGILYLHNPHTTAALTINEAADPSVVQDMIATLRRLVPENNNYRHLEGNSDAHVKASLLGCGLQLIIADMEPVLGTWQGIFFCEFDGPRTRKIVFKWTEK